MSVSTERLGQAIRLREEGRLDEALGLLRELHAAAPEDPLVNYHCAWTCDRMGDEAAAVPYYERAIELGLAGEDRRGAMLGLGSTYRCLGRHVDSVELLRRAVSEFPEARELQAFLALALYNTGEAREAVQLLLRHLAETSADPGVARYRRALLLYAEDPDRTW